MEHANARERFEYENDNRLTGDLMKASWLIDETAWSLCPLVPIRNTGVERLIHQAVPSMYIEKFTLEQIKNKTKEWVLKSRHNITGFTHQHGTFSSGVENFIDSTVYRCQSVASLPLTYYHVPDVAQQIGKPYHTISDAPEGATVVIELPTPQHSVDYAISQMREAKAKGHRVVVDTTFLPISTEVITADLSDADEVWISANKTWNTGDLRPAWRFSKEPIADALTLIHKRSRFNKASLAAWCYIIDSHGYDEIVDKYQSVYDHICKVFDLEPTNNILTARKKNIKWYPMYTDNWNYNNLIGTHNLIYTHGKHFW